MTSPKPAGPSEAAKKFVEDVLSNGTLSAGMPRNDIAKLFDAHVAQATERYREALRPFAEFARRFNEKPILSLHDELYGIHGGEARAEDGGISLKLSDCRKALVLLDGPAHDRDAEVEGGR